VLRINSSAIPMEKIVIIADDLTGAADTGVQFCPFFDRTILVSYRQFLRSEGGDSLLFSGAAAVYTNSRALGTGSARQRTVSVARSLTQIRSLWVYKKVDSCLRGNPGAETEALMDELGYSLSFIAPAFPVMGRTTEHGIHRVHGVPLHATELSKDPVAPVSESVVSRLVAAQCHYPVDHIDVCFLEEDEETLRAEIRRRARLGARHLVFDAVTDTHLDRIARLALTMDSRVLPVGSAGLAAGLGRCLTSGPKNRPRPPGKCGKGSILMVCGSTSRVTRLQVDTLTGTCPYTELRLDLGDLTGRDQDAWRLAKIHTARRILSGGHLVITVRGSADEGEQTDTPGGRRDAESIVKALGHLVAEIVTAITPGLLFLTGGDTADAVLTAAGVERINIRGEIIPGVAEGASSGGALEGVTVVTKAGAFGQKDTLVRLHEIWMKDTRKPS
jgi:D-threonate/D-erythronate kinase